MTRSRKCACGCGGVPKTPGSTYLPGHNMLGKSYPRNPTGRVRRAPRVAKPKPTPEATPKRLPLATQHEVARHLGIAVSTLATWRRSRRLKIKGAEWGPAFMEVAQAVRYDWRDIDSWEAARKVGRR